MEAKYYTPQISDIFIGFECELFYQDDFKLARTENLKWHKTIIDKNKFQQAFSLIKVNKIRVKHLDREDIESLGWNYSILAEKYCIIRNNDNGIESLGIWLNFIGDRIKIIDSRLPIHEVLFFGFIKNKSELKKLMQQLNIK